MSNLKSSVFAEKSILKSFFKGKMVLMLFILLLLSVANLTLAAENSSEAGNSGKSSNFITKTYELKYIAPIEVKNVLSPYVARFSYSYNSRFITVVISKENIQKFESLLKKIDRPRKNVLFKIYTVIGSRKKLKGNINNPELKNVVKQLSSLFSFKSYVLDSVSFISVKEGTRLAKVKLSSSYNLALVIRELVVNSVGGKRVINFGFHLLRYKGIALEGQNYEKLISSVTSVNNNKYFVAGVSSLEEDGSSLILIIKPTIKR